MAALRWLESWRSAASSHAVQERLPSRSRRPFSTATRSARRSASGVSHATRGLKTTLSSASSGWSWGKGSVARASRPAARKVPAANASASAAASTSPPGAVLTRIAPGFISPSADASTSRSVSGVSGRCRETTSLVSTSSRNGTNAAAASGSGRRPQ